MTEPGKNRSPIELGVMELLELRESLQKDVARIREEQEEEEERWWQACRRQASKGEGRQARNEEGGDEEDREQGVGDEDAGDEEDHATQAHQRTGRGGHGPHDAGHADA